MSELPHYSDEDTTQTRNPAGFMDIISIPKTGENYRLPYDTKGTYRSRRYSKQAMIIRAGLSLGHKRGRATHSSDSKKKNQSYKALML